MNMPTQVLNTNAGFEAWMEKRPESIKTLAKEFPFSTVWKIDNEDLVVVGWNESDTVLFSKLYLNKDDTVNIDRVMSKEERIHICAEHLRGNET